MRYFLSPKELAEVISVSESTIKRWVDKGSIKAVKTKGGHRKIAVKEAIRHIRENTTDFYHTDLIGFPDIDALDSDKRKVPLDSNLFYEYLIDGNAQKARGHLAALYLQGYSLAEIFDGPVQRSMSRIGELWTESEAGICREHHATDICIQAINALRVIFSPPSNAPVTLGGAPEDDPYFIPSLCAATVLMSEGYQAINLGPNTPIDSFCRSIDIHKPVLVWMSISSGRRSQKWYEEMEKLKTYLTGRNAILIIGGRNHHLVKSLADQNVIIGTSMRELVAFAKGLHLKTKK